MWVARPVKLPDGARVQARNPRITDLRAAYIRQRLLIQRCPNGRMVIKERHWDKVSNCYFERITGIETGEVIHECEEPLTEHRGHGSAKKADGNT